MANRTTPPNRPPKGHTNETTCTQNLIAAALAGAPGGNAIAQEPGRLTPLPDTENVK